MKYLYISLLIFFCSCATTKSGKNLFQTFFVGTEGTQYFIKPINFENGNGENIILDFTFRYKDIVKDSAVIKISLINNNIYKNLDSICFRNEINKFNISNIDFLFTEKDKTMFKSRFSTKVPLENIKNIFDNSKWEIKVYEKNNVSKYYATKKTQKIITKLKETIFILF